MAVMKKKGRSAGDDLRDEIKRQEIRKLTAKTAEEKEKAEKQQRGLKRLLAFIENRGGRERADARDHEMR